MGFDVIGFGALNVDKIISVDSLVLGGETYGRVEGTSGGGSAANMCIALQRMGFKTGYIGAVGGDEDGRYLKESLGMVDTSRVREYDGLSGNALSLVTTNGERTIVIIPGVNDNLVLKKKDLDYSNQAEFVHLTSFVGEGSLRAQIELAKNTQAKISFDPGMLYASKGNKIYPILKNTYVLFVNEMELKTLNPKSDLSYKKLVRDISDQFEIPIVACKRGEKGYYALARKEVFGKEETVSMIVKPLSEEEIVDPTGSGDVFDAGFLAALLKGAGLENAASFAHIVAKKSIKGIGREEYPQEKNLERHLKA